MYSGITRKINLSEYDYEKDIKNRMLMATFSVFEVEVLDEILNSSVTISLPSFVELLGIGIDQVYAALEKLGHTGLFTIEGDTITVDKETRKYYEFQILKFDENYHPDMEFFQGLLRKVPIHLLPIWYSIPRTSDNIFQSIVETFLITPRAYQRYLSDLKFEDPVIAGIVQDVFSSESLSLRSYEIREKYSLTREQFEEYMLHLEFNVLCCLTYARVGDQWKEVVTPFYEWKEFLTLQKQIDPKPISDGNSVKILRPEEFAFIHDISRLFQCIKSQSITLESSKTFLPDVETTKMFLHECLKVEPSSSEIFERYRKYVAQLIAKMCMLRLARVDSGSLYREDVVDEWSRMPLEEKARYLLWSPANTFVGYDVEETLCTDRNMRHVIRSLIAISGKGWVLYEDYFRTIMESIGETNSVMLRCRGRRWKYDPPEYSPEESGYIKAVIFEKLFESGVVNIGTYHGDMCIMLTPFGHSIVER